MPNHLDVSFIGEWAIQLADGARSKAAYFQTEIVWDEETRVVEIALLDNMPLLGVDLLNGYELRIEMTDGGEVSLEALN